MFAGKDKHPFFIFTNRIILTTHTKIGDGHG